MDMFILAIYTGRGLVSMVITTLVKRGPQKSVYDEHI